MTSPNKKRAGLNPKQLALMEQIRCLSEADVAKGARVVKKKMGLKACYPVTDTSLDPDLFHPQDIVDAGISAHTVRRYTTWFLGLAKKPDESKKEARIRYESTPHQFAPLVRTNDGKIDPRWVGVDWKGTTPPRLVSERILIFLVLGLAIVKGDAKTKARKSEARAALWRAIGIKPATVVPITPEDDVTFWHSVTTPVPDPEVVEVETDQTVLEFPNGDDVDSLLEGFGASPLNGGGTLLDYANELLDAKDEEDFDEGLEEGNGEDLILQGLRLLQQGVGQLMDEVKRVRASQASFQENQENLSALRKDLDAKSRDLDAREKAMREKEAVLAQVLRVTESLRDPTRP
jgi:hypothetical protein